ncbi:MAG: molybdenum cofactor guanylyltransferase [Leptolyngbyaceae cyanobacterium CSU_1_3]|nr:molybdenum cofactor guanylyltransferase [Leptolyngbyaceae cyanobacterium CSU_1_3]
MTSLKARPSLSAIVLAGGQSSRMGQDKALIAIDGVPLLRRVCEAALQCTSDVSVVTSWVDRYRFLLPPTVDLLVEVNPQGPLLGFAQALRHKATHGQNNRQTDWVLLLACDLPNLQGERLQEWLKILENVPSGAIALLPKNPKGWEPLCGFYRRDCLAELEDFTAQGGRSFQKWLAKQTVQELLLDCPDMMFNCNTPDDLAMT